MTTMTITNTSRQQEAICLHCGLLIESDSRLPFLNMMTTY